MAITQQMIDQAYSDLKETCGGVRNDYFGLVYLESEYDVSRERAQNQVAFGGHDYGIDGFHFNEEKRNLYLFQFKWSESHEQFKQSFQRLAQDGMERIFAGDQQDQRQNQLIDQLKSCLFENSSVIDKVLVHFVFRGDPEEAEKSVVLEQLREDLEGKKYLLDQFFGRNVTFVIEYRSAVTRRAVGAVHARRTHSYPLHLTQVIERTGPAGELMHVGFARLRDLHSMFAEMGQRFLDRNIRGALPPEEAVNRNLMRAFSEIIIEAKEAPSVFAFNHNGVSLAAEALTEQDGCYRVTEPRLLNGAQTVASFKKFLEKNQGNHRLAERTEAMDSLHVLCRVITNARKEFVTSVTISNNRQNPVEPWNLRANDLIQVELQEKFAGDLGIYYERQENAFANQSDEDLQESGVTQQKAIELLKLTHLYLVTDGDLDKMSRIREVFEEDRHYTQLFNERRLKVDSRKLLLCYKAQFRLRRLTRAIQERGEKKYAFMGRARLLLWALLCQGMLNANDLEAKAEKFGSTLTLEADYTEWLLGIAVNKCRHLIRNIVDDPAYADRVQAENFGFLRTNTAFKRAMEDAHGRYGWVQKRLK